VTGGDSPDLMPPPRSPTWCCKWSSQLEISRAAALAPTLLNALAMRNFWVAALVLTTACVGGTSGSEPAGSDGDANAPVSGSGAAGGAGVSFGGAQDVGDFQSILDSGGIPGPDTFDANGFFNEHYNAPAPASCGKLLCITSGLSVGPDWLTGDHQATLQIAIESTADPKTFQRLPMNLVVVVDHSGSMALDGRLDKVKSGLHSMVDNLLDGDRLALVEFDDVVTIDAALGTTLDRPALHAIVDGLTPRGGTDIYDGLLQGFQLLGDVPASERQNRVILLSDGNATSGDTVQADILAMAKDRVGRGIGLTTIGVGQDFDIALMRGLAEQGAGNFYFLEDPSAATEVFTEELNYFLQPIALDVQLTATAGPGYRFADAAGTTLWTNGPTSGLMQIPAVFVASRTTQSGEDGRRGGGSMIFIKMTPVAGNTGRVADLTMSFRTPGSTARTTQTVSLDYANDPNETPAQPYLSSPEMAERYAMYNMYLGIHAATQTHDLGCATALLTATRSNATTWNATHEDPDIAADLMLVDEYLGNLGMQGEYGEYSGAYPVSSCAVGTNLPGEGTPPPFDNTTGDDEPTQHYNGLACSTGGPAGGLPVVLGMLAVVIRRRRRRA
jgi:Ca-activated chloride channel family protein